MKRAIFAWIAIIALLGVAGSVYVYWNNSQLAAEQNARSQAAAKESSSDDTASVEEKIDRASQQPGVYEEYQEGLVASTDGVKLLFFHAPWCAQCRMLEDDIKAEGVPNGVTILKVDYDSNQDLRKKYGVTLQTTFVEIDDDRNEIRKFVAYNEPTFENVKANLLTE
jgi:thiol-disulfide isomerase/thioredoxin